MQIATFDWLIIILFFVISLGIGIYVSKSSGKSANQFFLSGRSMPWWLLGLSMVATTFSTDTPNLVTDIVRTNGVSGNWVWWAFLITGLLTVFVYAKLWRKSNVKTDLEFYELRYGGKPAKFLRKFRAIYLGIIFNVITMSAVTLAAIKIGGIMLGLEPWQTVLTAGLVTVTFSAIGANENVVGKISILPDFGDREALIALLIIPLAVQWWSSWYPGAEPGGGGYIAQRMFAAKNENHAIGATFFFNIMHYALRPWPWILVALASLVVFPDLDSIQKAFPNITADKLGNDLAYPAMLTKLPTGLLGLVLASLISAYMSTISTQLNWGSSYIVYDFYQTQINPDASEKRLVAVGRISTIILMVLSTILALALQNAMQLFNLLLVFGAGTGLIFILRWFWWRINAWSEITAMVASGLISLILTIPSVKASLFGAEGVFPAWAEFPFVVAVTTSLWVLATFITPPEDSSVLRSFYKTTQAGGPGWAKVIDEAKKEAIDLVDDDQGWSVPSGIVAMLLGCSMIYSTMFCTGYFIYGNYNLAFPLLGLAVVSGFLLIKIWKKIKVNVL